MERILDVQARLFVDEDFFTFVEVAGCIIPIGTIRVSSLEILQRVGHPATHPDANPEAN